MLREIEGLYSRIVGRCPAMPMSETGQTEKYSARADVFRSSSDNGRGFSARKGRYPDRRSWPLQPFVSPIHCYGTSSERESALKALELSVDATDPILPERAPISTVLARHNRLVA